MKEMNPNDPNEEWTFKKKRPRLNLGENFDGSKSTLEPWVEIDGVQIHPDRLQNYLKRKAEMEKKK